MSRNMENREQHLPVRPQRYRVVAAFLAALMFANICFPVAASAIEGDGTATSGDNVVASVTMGEDTATVTTEEVGTDEGDGSGEDELQDDVVQNPTATALEDDDGQNDPDKDENPISTEDGNGTGEGEQQTTDGTGGGSGEDKSGEGDIVDQTPNDDNTDDGTPQDKTDDVEQQDKTDDNVDQTQTDDNTDQTPNDDSTPQETTDEGNVSDNPNGEEADDGNSGSDGSGEGADHTHDAFCYDADGNLICAYKDVDQIEVTGFSALAVAAEETAYKCGDNLTWEVTIADDGATYTLKISGSGAMDSYTEASSDDTTSTTTTTEKQAPWAKYADKITTIVIDGDTTTTADGDATSTSDVTSIGDYAFQNFTALTSVTIPDSVKTIGKYAFSGCTALTNITLPSGLSAISEGLFKGCTSLACNTSNNQSVSIPSGVTTIGAYAFYGCGSANAAFYEISIPNSVTTIGDYAFSGCTYLKKVTIGDSVTSIGNYAFSGCTYLYDLTLGENVTTIGDYAFKSCFSYYSSYSSSSSKNTVTIPARVTSIGNYAFSNCKYLRKVEIGSDTAETKTTIGNYAFSGCTYLYDLTLGENVTTIGKYAFSGCTSSSFSSITIPASVTTIDDYAFSGCTSLRTINFGSDSALQTIGEYAFNGCFSYSSSYSGKITIPESVTSIGKYAFTNCKYLMTVTLPSTMTEIPEGLFKGCTKLKDITIPDGVTTIGSYAFSGCYSYYNYSRTYLSGGNPYYTDAQVAITIPKSVTTIKDHAFANCAYLRQITIGSAPTTGTEDGQSSTTTLQSDLKTIEGYAFSGCGQLKTINIPSGVTEIPESMMQNCSSLESITFDNEENITAIGDSAFSGCKALTAFTVPTGVSTIAAATFSGCTALHDVTIPATLTEIGDSAFASCTALKEIKIGKGGEPLTAEQQKKILVNATAFKNSGVETLVVGTTADTLYGNLITGLVEAGIENMDIDGPNEFVYTGSKVTMGYVELTEGTYYASGYVVGESTTAASTTDGDTTESSTKTSTGKLYRLNAATDNGMPTATLVRWPSDISATYIDATISDLLNVTDTKGTTYYVTALGDFAFTDHKELASVVIPTNITKIGDRTFENCTVLASVRRASNTQFSDDDATVLSKVVDETKSLGASLSTYRNTALSGNADINIDAYKAQNAVGTKLILEKKEENNSYKLSVDVFVSSNYEDYFEENQYEANSLLTGETANISITLAEVNHAQIQDTLRVYFRTTATVDGEKSNIFGDGTMFGYAMDTEHSFTDGDGKVVVGYFHATSENEGYFEVVRAQAGVTYTLNLSAQYAKYTSGGNLLIWVDDSGGTALPKATTDEAGNINAVVSQVKWKLAQMYYDVQKSGSGTNLTIAGNAVIDNKTETDTYKKGDTPYVNGLSYTVTVTSKGLPEGSYGAVMAENVQFVDTLTLPDGFNWAEDVIDVLKQYAEDVKTDSNTQKPYTFNISTSSSSTMASTVSGTIYVTVTDSTTNKTSNVQLCALTISYNSSVYTKLDKANCKVEVTQKNYDADGTETTSTKDEIQITLAFTNSSRETKLGLNSFTLTYGSTSTITTSSSQSRAIEADTEKLNKQDSTTFFYNNVQMTGNYYQNSSNKIEEAANGEVKKDLKAALTFTKTGSSQTMSYDDTFTLTLANNTALTYTGLTTVRDRMPSWFYIEPTNMEKMFKDTYGGGLTISITDGTLCRTTTQANVTTASGGSRTVDQKVTCYEGTLSDSTTASTDYDYLTATSKDECKVTTTTTGYADFTFQCVKTETTNTDESTTVTADKTHWVMTMTVPRSVDLSYWEYYKNESNNSLVTCTTDGTNDTNDTYTMTIGADTDGQTYPYHSILAALDAVGYLVNANTVYNCVWEYGDVDEGGANVKSGETLKFYLYATVKSTPMLLQNDKRYSYRGYSTTGSYVTGVSNYAYYYRAQKKTDADGQETGEWVENVAGNAYKTISIYNEMKVTKTASSGGTTLSSTSRIESGDVILYTNSASIGNTNYLLTGNYGAVPMVDKMSNGQVLLVPAADNETLLKQQLISAGYMTESDELSSILGTKIIGNTTYYILDKAGTYTGLKLGSYYTDKIVVRQATDSEKKDTTVSGATGLVTMIYWYLTSSISPTYYALAQPSNVSESGSFALKDEVWLGDHETRRVYDYVTTGGTMLGADKKIVTNVNDDNPLTADRDPSKDALSTFEFVESGESVTYRLTIATTGESSLTLNGGSLYDTLPATLTSVPWSKENISMMIVPGSYSTLTYEYKTTSGNTTTTKWTVDGTAASDNTLSAEELNDIWDVTRISSSSSGALNQKIAFSSNFYLTLKGTLYIYVTLTFPSGESWAPYCAKYGATTLYNTWYVYGLSYSVSHMLADVSEGALLKSVLYTGTESGTFGSYGYYNGTYYNSNSRKYSINTNTDRNWYYTNRMSKEGIVTYGVTIYNSGNTYLYLTEVEDILPKGFTFYSLYYTSDCTYYSSSYATSRYAGSYSGMMTVKDANRTSTSYYSAITINAQAGAVDKDGRQTVTFTFTNYNTGKANDPINPTLALSPGQYITIVYNCKTNGYSDTEDVAENKAVMRLYDYTGKGAVMNADGITIAGTKRGDVINNDGDSMMVDASQVDLWGMDTSHGSADSNYLASAVTVYRGQVIPGISKSAVHSYVTTTDEIEWKITTMNDGNGSLYDYTVTDVMMSPYHFTGNVTYAIKSKTGNTVKNTQTLFTVLKTSGNTVKLQERDGKTVDWLTVGGDTLTLNTLDLGKIQVRMDWNDGGDLILSIRFMDEEAALMAGYQGTLNLQTIKDVSDHENKSYVNECYITPNIQTFSGSAVTHGSFQYFNAEIDLDAPESGTEEAKTYKRDSYQSVASPSVKGQAQVQVSYGYATTSIKSVTELDLDGKEIDNKTNSAASTNSITLTNGTSSVVRYGTQVNSVSGTSSGGTGGSGMSLFVLVDNLPEVGDHMTMYQRYSRDSEFKVDFATNLDPEIRITYTYTNSDGKDVTVVNTLTSNSYTTTVEGAKTSTTYTYTAPEDLPYELLFSAQTDLDYEDNQALWQGGDLTEADGWYTAEKCTEYGIWHKMRSVRLVIKDDACNLGVDADPQEGNDGLMPSGATIEFFFNAKVCNEATTVDTKVEKDPNAPEDEDQNLSFDTETSEKEEESAESKGYRAPTASAVAWNSFGYLYQMGASDEHNGYLRAAPQVVGIRMPSAPTLTKELVDYSSSPYQTEEEEGDTFTFLVYHAADQGLDASKTSDELLAELDALDIRGTLVRVTVGGKNETNKSSASVELSNLYIYEKTDETTTIQTEDPETGQLKDTTIAKWSPSNTSWSWTDGDKYTVMELDMANNKDYALQSLNGSRKDVATFTYFGGSQNEILAVNQRTSWSLSITKRSSEDGSLLAGAKFGLYTQDKALAIVPVVTEDETYEGIPVVRKVYPKQEEEKKDEAENETDGETTTEGENGTVTGSTSVAGGTVVSDDTTPENQSDASGETQTPDETETETGVVTWYLIGIDTTDENGHIRWNGLTATDEYLVELVPPEGYQVADDVKITGKLGTVDQVEVEDDIDPEYFHLRVNKVWEDEGHEDERPESVTVTLRKNGVAVEQQQLSEANGWTYNWLGLTPTAEWTVTEDDVPSGYSASTTVDGRTVTITNTRDGSLFLPTVLLVGIPWLIEKLSQLLMDPTPLGDLSLTDPVSTPDETPQEVENPGPVYQLPQTGLNRLPVWIMLGAGVALIAVGLYLNSKGRKGKHYAEKKDKKGQNPAQTPAEKPDEPDPTPQPPKETEKQEEDPQIKP